MREIDRLAVEAATDEKTMNNFIDQNEFFILKFASSVARHYISKNDDEWSVALLAFSEAIKNYMLDKGNFFKFAQMVMRRRLIDYMRNKSKYNSEILVSPAIFDSTSEGDDELPMKIAVTKKLSYTTDNPIKLEIETVNEVFLSYGFSFYDLANCSPKAKKTKEACIKAAVFLLKNPILVKDLKVTKLFPLKIVENMTKIPRKILERHRKYIIAEVEIISGEYPHLAEYMQFIREELAR